MCSLRVERKRGRPSKAESPPTKASPLQIMSVAAVHFGSPPQIAQCVSVGPSVGTTAGGSVGLQQGVSASSAMLATSATVITSAVAIAATAEAGPSASAPTVVAAQQLGPPRPHLVLPYGAAGADGAWTSPLAQTPAVPAVPVAQAAPAALAPATQAASTTPAGVDREAWMRQASQPPQRFNGPMFVMGPAGQMVPLPMPGSLGGDVTASVLMMAPGQAAQAQMLYCAAPMVAMAPPPTPVRVVCRGCGLVRMEVEGKRWVHNHRQGKGNKQFVCDRVFCDCQVRTICLAKGKPHPPLATPLLLLPGQLPPPTMADATGPPRQSTGRAQEALAAGRANARVAPPTELVFVPAVCVAVAAESTAEVQGEAQGAEMQGASTAVDPISDLDSQALGPAKGEGATFEIASRSGHQAGPGPSGGMASTGLGDVGASCGKSNGFVCSVSI